MADLVLGGSGRLGSALCGLRAARAPSRSELDLATADEAALEPWIRGSSAVINASAMALVDRCEAEPELAFALNAALPGRLAAVCARLGVPLIHVSTDYVFGDGAGPWQQDDPCCPLQVYGRSKAAGEAAVLAHGATVVRVSWLFGPGASPYADYVLRQASAGEGVAVFVDQQSRPTSLEGLAPWLLALSDLRASGASVPAILHPAGGPTASRGDWARALLDARGLHDVAVVDQGEGTLLAQRPADSRLEASATQKWSASVGLPEIEDWQDAVRRLASAPA